MTEDEKAIRKLVDDWMIATRAKDKDKVLGFIAEDVLFITPFGPPFGKAEFAGAPGNSDMPNIEGAAKILELEIAGDRAWTRCQIDIAITMKDGGEAKRMSGLTLSIYKKEADGKWRIYRDANFVKPEE